MSTYINTETSDYPITYEMIQTDLRNMSLAPEPDFQGAGPYVIVKPSDKPTNFDARIQQVREGQPTLVENEWFQTWNILEIFSSDADKAAAIAASETAIKANLQLMVVMATQKRLDDFAAQRNYDGIMSACTYATSKITKFSVEGQYAVDVRDSTWSKLYSILAEVLAGTRPMPSSFADVESELPTLEWPQ